MNGPVYDGPEVNEMTSKDGKTHEQLRIPLGRSGPRVSPIALGCMGMSGMYGATDDAQGLATIHAAIERGVNLLDTGDFYGMGHNELLVGRAIAGRRDKVLLSVKFGALRSPDGAWAGVDTRPAAIKNFLAYSLRRLGVDHIDIYRPARLDPSVPIEETVGAIAELIEKGYVRHIGLSEVSADTVRRAQAVHPIADLQIEYSIVTRGPEQKIFPALHELGVERDPVRRAVARPARRQQAERRERLSVSSAALLEREPRAEQRLGPSAARLRGGPRNESGSARDRLGAREAARLRHVDRCAHSGAVGIGARRARSPAIGGRCRAARAADSSQRDCWDALRRVSDGASR